MERFTDRKQLLFGGTSIIFIERGEVTFYEYLMRHPKNRRYVLALNRNTQDVSVLKLDDMKQRNCFVGFADWRFINETIAEQLRKRLKEVEEFLND